MLRVAGVFVLVCQVCCSGADWKAATGPLMTTWAADVDPKSPLPDYPRPQMVREKWLNLNGLWQYELPKDQAAADTLPIGKELPDQILVPFPFESALSGVMKRGEWITYRRTFEVPKEWAGQHVQLNFGAVNWQSVVLVNGKKLGMHQGGYDPFSYDITEALKEGANELIVSAFNPADKGEQPRGKQVRNPNGIFYLPSTGIWQTVWLEPVSKAHIADLVITPDVDSKSVEVKIKLDGEGANLGIDAEINLKTPTQSYSHSSSMTGGNVLTLKLPVGDPALWEPNSPTLYDLKLRVRDNGAEVDAVKSYFAMRKIELGKDNGVTKILLNGKFVFQMGELDQGFWPDGLYTAPTEAALKFDIEVAKELGFNMIRKHVKVEPQRWYYWTDKLGVLVWQDMPSGNDKPSPAGQKQHELELQRLIENLRNHPSIVLWVVFNEGWGQYDTERLTAWVKQFDPTRLTDNASGWTDKKCGDVIDMHNYPGPGAPKVEETRAAVLGEYGGVGLAMPGHQWVKSDKNWGYNGLQKDAEGLTKRYETLLRKTYGLVQSSALSAAVYTQITDVETESNGLLTYDRIMKGDTKRIAAANKGELPPLGEARQLVPTSQKNAQTWRYSTTDPGADWFKPEFNDSQWKEGPGGFGTEKTPGAVVRTVWDTADIWLRRKVDVTTDNFDGTSFLCHHDEDVEIYINGVKAGGAAGFISDYEEMPMNDEGRKALKKGENLIAVKCHQTKGGQYVDMGILAPGK